ncbi:MAG: RidA family protein [Candidatus Moraniibacteriota bacterium]|jgi:2-iminobutanoate/2-iminopropanoate deaminase
MTKNKALIPKGAKPKETYSHGISVPFGDREMIFVTGQIAAKNGEAVAPGDIEKQTEYIFNVINDILKAGNASLDDVVKAVIYVKDVNDFSKISPIRNKYFKKSKPVSTLVEMSNTVRKGCDIEIDVIAVK